MKYREAREVLEVAKVMGISASMHTYPSDYGIDKDLSDVVVNVAGNSERQNKDDALNLIAIERLKDQFV